MKEAAVASDPLVITLPCVASQSCRPNGRSGDCAELGVGPEELLEELLLEELLLEEELELLFFFLPASASAVINMVSASTENTQPKRVVIVVFLEKDGHTAYEWTQRCGNFIGPTCVSARPLDE